MMKLKSYMIVIIATCIVCGLTVISVNSSTEKRINQAHKQELKYKKQLKIQNINKKQTIKELPNIYTTIEKKGNLVLQAQNVLNKAVFNPALKRTQETTEAFITLSKYVDNSQSMAPATTAWIKMTDWTGDVNIGGSNDGIMFDISFTYRDKNDKIVAVVRCQYDRDTTKFENFDILVTKDGATQQADAISAAQNNVVH